MSNRESVIGAVLLALLAVVDIILLVTAFDPPTAILVTVMILDVVVLVALGAWVAGRSRRLAMRVAVIAAALTTVMAIAPLLMPDITTGERVYSAVFVALAAVAIFLVRRELGRRPRGTPASAARAA